MYQWRTEAVFPDTPEGQQYSVLAENEDMDELINYIRLMYFEEYDSNIKNWIHDTKKGYDVCHITRNVDAAFLFNISGSCLSSMPMPESYKMLAEELAS